MNKSELITAMAKKTGFTKKDSEKAILAFQEVIKDALVAGDKIQMIGFGSFEVAERAEKDGRDPNTGEPIKISAYKTPKFKAGKYLKDAVNA